MSADDQSEIDRAEAQLEATLEEMSYPVDLTETAANIPVFVEGLVWSFDKFDAGELGWADLAGPAETFALDVEAYRDIFAETTPPERFRSMHERWLAGLDQLAGSGRLLQQAAQDEDEDAMERAVGVFQSADAELERIYNEAVQVLEDWSQEG